MPRGAQLKQEGSIYEGGAPGIAGGDPALYWQKVRSINRGNLLGYWRLNESSGVVAADSSDNGRDGTATGVTWLQAGIGDGYTGAGFDGVNDYVNVYSAGLAAQFNPLAGTLMVWARANIGAWADGALRSAVRLQVDNNNYVLMGKHTAVGFIYFRYVAGGTSKQVLYNTASDADWMLFVMTWNTVADEMKCYFNGTQVGSTQTGLGIWAGALVNTGCTIGSSLTIPVEVFSGDLAHAAVWNTTFSVDEIERLAEVAP